VHIVTRGYFPARDKDGGLTIRSAIADNPMIHANPMALKEMGEISESLRRASPLIYFSAGSDRPSGKLNGKKENKFRGKL